MGGGSSKPATSNVNTKKPTTIAGEQVWLKAGDSDPASLTILQLIRDADELEQDPSKMLAKVKQAAAYLTQVPPDNVDAISVLVFQREGFAYALCRSFNNSKIAFGKAIQIAEVMVAEDRPQLFMVLQRYCDSVMRLANLWEFEALAVTTKGANNNVPLVESARAKAIRVYGPCEVALLRCIELIERGDHRQSELLLLPLLELSRIYEALFIYARAVLVIRRCIGILCVRYGHDHMRIIDLNARCDHLLKLRDDQRRIEAVIKLQSLARMFAAMYRLEATLQRRVRRHRLPPKVLRGTTASTSSQQSDQRLNKNGDFLSSYANILWAKNGATTTQTINLGSTTTTSTNMTANQSTYSSSDILDTNAILSSSNTERSTTIPLNLAPPSPSKRVGIPPPSPNTNALAPSRPMSGGLGLRQTALVNAGFAPGFARSSFAVHASRPTSADSRPDSANRPSSGGRAGRIGSTTSPATDSLTAAEQRNRGGLSSANNSSTTHLSPPAFASKSRQDAPRLSIAALGGTTQMRPAALLPPLVSEQHTTVTLYDKQTLPVADTVVVRRSRLRSWAAHDLTQ